MQSNNECDTSITDAAVSSEVILGVFLSHGSASSVTDDLHINSVWAELCGPGETERERERKGKGRWGTASLCVSYYRRHMAHWIEILIIPYVLVLNGFTYFSFLSIHTLLITCAHSSTTYCWTGFLATGISRTYSLTLFDIIWHMTSLEMT